MAWRWAHRCRAYHNPWAQRAWALLCRHREAGHRQRVDALNAPPALPTLLHPGVNVVAAAAGRYSTMAVDYDGRLYVWGRDGCASDGKLPDQALAWKPRAVGGELATSKVVAFDAGAQQGMARSMRW